MNFASIEFFIFLPVVFLLYYFVFSRSIKLQNGFIVVVSYIFYGWWDWRFLILISITIILSWGSGILLLNISNQEVDTKTKKYRMKIISVANIIVNLSILCFFKYFNFFIQNFISAFSFIGLNLNPYTLNIILPVGISFYTFQALSYTIDVYKKKLEPTKDIISFIAFVSFFPQLLAGPIERAGGLLPQFYRKRAFVYENAVDGSRQILWGLFKKMVIADNCAGIVNMIFDAQDGGGGSSYLLGAIFFAFQIYGDFSGYSDIAIGAAKLFGFNLTKNFAFPYFSRDIAEFWRRWHITLSTWFRDYVYIPLGGSRGPKWKIIRNTFVIFLLSGFWHGANWTFILWGLYHGALFLPLVLIGSNRKNISSVSSGKSFPSVKELLQIVTTFLLVVFGWIIFRCDNLTSVFTVFSKIFSPSLFSLPNIGGRRRFFLTIFLIIICMIMEWAHREKEFGLQINGIKYRIVRWAVYVILMLMIIMFQGNQSDFIYFQF
jgi:D-alanyl-lipoteichoic acid acyltransferase DltB (MBOAT superfamily)